MTWSKSFEQVDNNEEVEDNTCNLDIFFLQQLNLIKIDITSYLIKEIVNLMNDEERTRILIRCTKYGVEERIRKISCMHLGNTNFST